LKKANASTAKVFQMCCPGSSNVPGFERQTSLLAYLRKMKLHRVHRNVTEAILMIIDAQTRGQKNVLVRLYRNVDANLNGCISKIERYIAMTLAPFKAYRL
jgi:hypothetical protein